MRAPSVTPPVESEDFKARSHSEGNRLRIHMSGTADLRAKDALDAFLCSVDEEAVAVPVNEVVVDLHELAFMNSSCLKALVAWLSSVQERPTQQQYRIRFLRAPSAHWQTRSLGALAAFAAGIVQVE
jgi:hypothetical protein